MNPCESIKILSEGIKNFMLQVPYVKEESITDYLVWQWGEFDNRFHYINISTFTRQEESTTTGADFELELWLVGRSVRFPLLFQAKKFVKPFDSYRSKLNYPNGTQAQLTKLLNYSSTNNRLPFYMFYSLPDPATKVMCPKNDIKKTAMFMVDAFTIKEFADGKQGSRLPLNTLLKSSNPFHCLFCCPLSNEGEELPRYLHHYFSGFRDEIGLRLAADTPLPNYVIHLLDGRTQEMTRDELRSIVYENELQRYRCVAVYDLRDSDL